MRNLLVISALALTIGTTGYAQTKSAPAPAPAAAAPNIEAMERQMWKDIASGNAAGVASHIATGFQSLHQDGPRDKAGELALIKGLKVGQYTLSNFKVVQSGNAQVVTYTIAIQETIDGARAGTAPAQRLSVWQQTPQGWQWIAHANLNTISKK
jgi:hypothetical protein